jgi:hypothetical protein
VDDHKARRRAFIRAHHPDRGGDPAAFVAGLAALDNAPIGHTRARVIIVARRPLWRRVLRALFGWRRVRPRRVR